LTALEDTHAAVLASYREGQAALDVARGEAGRLGKEAGQAAALVEKLEDRYAVPYVHACMQHCRGLCFHAGCCCWQLGCGLGGRCVCGGHVLVSYRESQAALEGARGDAVRLGRESEHRQRW
jgi:hypothetical protein